MNHFRKVSGDMYKHRFITYHFPVYSNCVSSTFYNDSRYIHFYRLVRILHFRNPDFCNEEKWTEAAKVLKAVRKDYMEGE